MMKVGVAECAGWRYPAGLLRDRSDAQLHAVDEHVKINCLIPDGSELIVGRLLQTLRWHLTGGLLGTLR